jgi:hypothetical protein
LTTVTPTEADALIDVVRLDLGKARDAWQTTWTDAAEQARRTHTKYLGGDTLDRLYVNPPIITER